jgi:hypothetical protein
MPLIRFPAPSSFARIPLMTRSTFILKRVAWNVLICPVSVNWRCRVTHRN